MKAEQCPFSGEHADAQLSLMHHAACTGCSEGRGNREAARTCGGGGEDDGGPGEGAQLREDLLLEGHVRVGVLARDGVPLVDDDDACAPLCGHQLGQPEVLLRHREAASLRVRALARVQHQRHHLRPPAQQREVSSHCLSGPDFHTMKPQHGVYNDQSRNAWALEPLSKSHDSPE
jgi:hypothetical protein